jgi:hypothetical protein
VGISRERVMLRTRYGWAQGTVKYDPSTLHQPDGYRQDEGGFVSMCWDIPPYLPGSYGGMNTVSLDSGGWAIEIPPTELKPGDAIGLLGPQTAGRGVIVMVEGWLNNDPNLGYVICWDMLPDSSPGPVRRARPYSFQWHCYRFRDIED